MTQPISSQDLLTRRLRLVAGLSALNEQALKLTQVIAGVDMEVLRLELALKQAPAEGELARELRCDLQAMRESADVTAGRQRECAGRIETAEQEIEELDRLLRQAVEREGRAP
ncbi:hypothetical protein C5L14_29160 [Labrys okinawensis]|uniref:Uncharacterized protein n=1 Tax=Labrys okinawensis TaxID=346911 RepID=A0A2S9Q3K1_9HYPH|nr:hypothetical protein [Labrys okinawensis]PRH83938.1 hypothetical protein C5L14_29160 [Labrys okinawensis]